VLFVALIYLALGSMPYGQNVSSMMHSGTMSLYVCFLRLICGECLHLGHLTLASGCTRDSCV